jgi:hypothetical protein
MRLKMLGLCLIAVFSMAAMAVASASAETLPKFNECAKVKTGTEAKGCKGPGKGYEKKEGFKGKGKGFKGVGKAASLHTSKLKSEITCKANKDVGTITGEKTEGGIVATFTGCATLGKKCKSGATAGTIVTHSLKGVLGYINASAHEVGADLTPTTGTALANFECEGLVVETTGSVIGVVTPVNVFTKKLTSTFAVNGAGEQVVKKLENEPTDVLFSTIGGQGPFESGQQDTVVNTGEELELQA